MCPTREELLSLRYGDRGGPPMDYDDAGIQTRGTRAAAAAVMQASTSLLTPTFDEGSSNDADVLLQTHEWFPLERALTALAAFRQTRLAFAAASHKQQSSTIGPHPTPDDLDSALGDDPLIACSGQVIIGIESKYRIVYHLINTIYVLGITTVDRNSNRGRCNVFECINTVNQAVSVVVAACRGIDITPEKLHCKYPEIYMALNIVLHGIGTIRLATILSSIHNDNIAKMVHTAIDIEIRIRSANTWSGSAKALSLKRRSNLDTFSRPSSSSRQRHSPPGMRSLLPLPPSPPPSPQTSSKRTRPL